MNAILIVVGLLALLTGLNLFILLGVIRRLREISGSMAGDMEEAGLPSAGDPVGRFAVATVDGGMVGDEQLRRGRTLVVFLTPSCPPCLTAADQLAEQSDSLRLPTMVFVQAESSDPKLPQLLTTLDGVGTIALVSHNDAASIAFGGILGFPSAILVEDGTVRAASLNLSTVVAAHQDELLSR